MALGLDHLEPECQKVELNPAVVMRLLDRRMTEAASIGGLMRLRLWDPPNFLLWQILLQNSSLTLGKDDSVAVRRFAAEAVDDGAAQARPGTVLLFILP